MKATSSTSTFETANSTESAAEEDETDFVVYEQEQHDGTDADHRTGTETNNHHKNDGLQSTSTSTAIIRTADSSHAVIDIPSRIRVLRSNEYSMIQSFDVWSKYNHLMV